MNLAGMRKQIADGVDSVRASQVTNGEVFMARIDAELAEHASQYLERMFQSDPPRIG